MEGVFSPSICYSSHGNGLLAKQNYANSGLVSFDYNHQNQVKQNTYSDGRTTTYTYPPDGQVHRAKESGGGKAIDYVYTFSA